MKILSKHILLIFLYFAANIPFDAEAVFTKNGMFNYHNIHVSSVKRSSWIHMQKSFSLQNVQVQLEKFHSGGRTLASSLGQAIKLEEVFQISQFFLRQKVI